MPRGGKRQGAGRPSGSRSVRKDNALSVQVAVRLTAAEKAELEARAAAASMTVSRYIHGILFT